MLFRSQLVFGAVKINYAGLSNVCPHAHCHLVPLSAGNPPRLLDMSEGMVTLDEVERAKILADLRHYLRQLANAWGRRTGP